MSKGLALTRSASNDELYLFVKDSSGEIVKIKQTIKHRSGTQVMVVIDAPPSVNIVRGELIS